MSANGNGGSGMSGFVLGAVVGAGLALMYAPCSGRDTRQWLSRKTRELRGMAEDAYVDAKDTIRRETKSLVGEVKDVARGHATLSHSIASDKGRS